MADPVSAIAVMIAAEVGKSALEVEAANQKEAALDLQGKELELQTQQKTLKNYDVMEKVLDAQIAHMTTTGTAFSSPSFNAIQRNTENIGGKRQKSIDIEGEIAQENIKLEKQNVQNSLWAQLFGNVAQGALGTADIAGKMPKKTPTLEE